MAREIQPIIDAIQMRLSDVLSDYGVWYPRLVDLAKRGYPKGSDGGSRSPGISDPTGSAALTLDEIQQERRVHDREMAELLSLVKRLEKRRSWLMIETRKGFDPLPVVCETCSGFITQKGSDVPREGECQKCYRHRTRYGLPWPMVRVTGRSSG